MRFPLCLKFRGWLAVLSVPMDPGHGSEFIFLQGSYCNHEIHVLKSRRSACRDLLPPVGAWGQERVKERQVFSAIYEYIIACRHLDLNWHIIAGTAVRGT